MEQRDWKPFCALMEATAESLGAKPRSEAGLLIIFEALRPYPFEAVRAAVGKHLVSAEGKFFPTAAHIVQQIRGTEAERAELAWRRVVSAVSRRGCYDSVRFPEPAYHFAIRELGGWERLVSMVDAMTDREIEFFGQKFAKLYAAGERCASWTPTAGRECVPAYFQGSFERENRARGFLDAIPAPVDALTGEKLDRAALAGGTSGVSATAPHSAVASLASRLCAKTRENAPKPNDVARGENLCA